jgi:hypothetical protein
MVRRDSCARGAVKGLVDVPEDVVDVLQPHRHAHHVGWHAGGQLLFVAELAVRGADAGWMISVRVSPMLARWLMNCAPIR